MIAPNKVESRLYQKTISNTCSQKNSLVILPTALGKTIIALLTAIKRLDVYPWAKILLLAPTRPLVLQHFETFSQFLVFDENKINMFTGKNTPNERVLLWEQSQFIFATPQVINNDLENGRYDLNEVALLIFDEAHRARENYAYTKIAPNYIKNNKDPLILALTASPGKNKERIQELCKNLFIEVIEFRTENDLDVKDYINPIQIEWYKLKLPNEYINIKHLLEEILHNYLKKLHQMSFLLNKPIQYISKMDLIDLGNRLRAHVTNQQGNSDNGYYYSAIVAQAASISLMHALELLTTQDIEVFLNFLNKLEHDSDEMKNKYSQSIIKDSRFQKIKAFSELHANSNHIKMNKLRDIILEELQSNKNSKIIVFTQYRDTASKIVEKLQILPSVKPIRFVGQSSKREDIGLSQNEQAEILEEFRFDKYNVLIATCIAEEGLDIPAVELVVFYEPIPSEIRYIQRKGRTGRKKFGKVKILITEDTVDEAFFYVSLKREKQMKEIVTHLEKELNTTIHRTPLIKPEKPNLQENVININKNFKRNYKKLQSSNTTPETSDFKVNKWGVKEFKIKSDHNPTSVLTNFKSKNTKGLSNAVQWVLKRAVEFDNGDGINIDEFLKISTLENYDTEKIMAAISKLINEGVLYQPNPLKISVV